MKVVMISGDRRMLDQGSDAARRLALQRSVVDQLEVFVWPQRHPLVDILRATRVLRPDVCTVQDPFFRGLLGFALSRIFGARFNVQVHADLAEQSLWQQEIAHFVLRRADTVRVVSEKLKEQMLLLGLRADIRVLPVFVDVAKYRAITPRAHSGKNILWIGRFEEEKNPLQAILILKEVLKVVPDATLTFLGAGSLGPAIQTHVKNLPVQVLGWQEDLTPFLETGDVVLCTSLHESWGASIIEALASGVPVVAPDVGVAREAGAFVVPRDRLGAGVIEVITKNLRGDLRIPMFTSASWAAAWRETI